MQSNKYTEVKVSNRNVFSRFFSFIASPFTKCCKKKNPKIRPEIEKSFFGGYQIVPFMNDAYHYNILHGAYKDGPNLISRNRNEMPFEKNNRNPLRIQPLCSSKESSKSQLQSHNNYAPVQCK